MVVKYLVTKGTKAVVKKVLKKARKKANKFAEQAIVEAGTPGKKLRGWSKIAAPGVPFHIKKILEGPDKK